MSFEETAQRLEEMFEYESDMEKYFREDRKETIISLTRDMITTLDKLNSGKSVAVGENMEDCLVQYTNRMVDVCLEEGLTDWYKDFVMEFAKLANNFNNNVLNNYTVKRNVKTIDRLIKSHWALDDLIKKSKKIKYDNRHRESTRLARHYLDSIEEENSEEE